MKPHAAIEATDQWRMVDRTGAVLWIALQTNITISGFEVTHRQLQTVASNRLHFSDWQGWPVTLASPGVMGPYSFAPFMECNHGILSMDHCLSGALTFETLDAAYKRQTDAVARSVSAVAAAEALAPGWALLNAHKKARLELLTSPAPSDEKRAAGNAREDTHVRHD